MAEGNLLWQQKGTACVRNREWNRKGDREGGNRKVDEIGNGTGRDVTAAGTGRDGRARRKGTFQGGREHFILEAVPFFCSWRGPPLTMH